MGHGGSKNDVETAFIGEKRQTSGMSSRDGVVGEA